MVFSELYTRPNAVWALLLAADYVTAPGDVHTVIRAWEQIEERAYVAGFVARGIAPERIRTYSIAFCGKDVLVG